MGQILIVLIAEYVARTEHYLRKLFPRRERRTARTASAGALKIGGPHAVNIGSPRHIELYEFRVTIKTRTPFLWPMLIGMGYKGEGLSIAHERSVTCFSSAEAKDGASDLRSGKPLGVMECRSSHGTSIQAAQHQDGRLELTYPR